MSAAEKELPASPLLTRKEAADYLRISIATFERLHIEGFRIGGRRVFYTKEILDEWLARKKPRSTSAAKPVVRSSTSAPPKAGRSLLSVSLSETARRTVEKLEKRARRNGES